MRRCNLGDQTPTWPQRRTLQNQDKPESSKRRRTGNPWIKCSTEVETKGDDQPKHTGFPKIGEGLCDTENTFFWLHFRRSFVRSVLSTLRIKESYEECQSKSLGKLVTFRTDRPVICKLANAFVFEASRPPMARLGGPCHLGSPNRRSTGYPSQDHRNSDVFIMQSGLCLIKRSRRQLGFYSPLTKGR